MGCSPGLFYNLKNMLTLFWVFSFPPITKHAPGCDCIAIIKVETIVDEKGFV